MKVAEIILSKYFPWASPFRLFQCSRRATKNASWTYKSFITMQHTECFYQHFSLKKTFWQVRGERGSSAAIISMSLNLAFMKICLSGTGARLSNISQIHLPAWRWWYAVMWLQVCLDDCWKTKFLAGNTESIYGWRDKMDPSYMIQSDSARRAQYPDTQQTVTFISDNGEHLALFYVRGT